MLRTLGITTALKWFLIACVAVAIWQGFNGDLAAIARAIWSWIEAGAGVVSNIWNAINK